MNKIFIDTNIVVYYYTSTEPEKKRRAASLLLHFQSKISTQVLSELANVLSKKYSFSWQQIASVYKELTNLFDIVLIKPESVRKAIEISEQYRYSYYDSLILASALEAECSILYSEDFQHGQIIEGMKIINPFV